jgi:hypothetical protein
LWVSPASFATITLCVTSQRVCCKRIFRYDSVRKLLDTLSYNNVGSRERTELCLYGKSSTWTTIKFSQYLAQTSMSNLK